MIYPYYDIDSEKLIDGTVYKLCDFCKKQRLKCVEFYNNIFFHRDGFIICPYGFTVYKNNRNIITGIIVKNHYLKNKVNPKKYCYKSIPENEFINNLNLINELNKFKSLYNESESLVFSIVHDIRKYNRDIKISAQRLSSTNKDFYSQKDIKYINDIGRNIFRSSTLISAWLDHYQRRVNPESLGKRTPKNIRNMFLKSINLLKNEANKKKIKSQIDQCYRIFDCFDSMETVPYCILDNAIKYSPSDNIIRIYFNEVNSSDLKICVESIGPILIEDEEKRVFEKKYRGSNAKKLSISGSGVGLFLIREICKENDCDIKIKSSKKCLFKTPDGVEYSNFLVEIIVHNTSEDWKHNYKVLQK